MGKHKLNLKGNHPKWTKTGKNSKRKWIPSDSQLYGGQMSKYRKHYVSRDNTNYDKINWDE